MEATSPIQSRACGKYCLRRLVMRLVRATRRLTSFRRCSHRACSSRVGSESGIQGRSFSECLVKKSSSSSESVGSFSGTRGVESFSVTSQGLGVDRKQNEEGIHHQGVNDGAFALLDGDGDPTALEALDKPGNPLVQCFGFLFQLEGFGLRLAGDL